MTGYHVFELGTTVLQRGMTVPNLRLIYQTYGTLNQDRSNAILYPTSYAAQHTDTEWLIGPGRILDPREWFIIIPNMFGNGMSCSPSNLGEPFGHGRYPEFTHWDNIHAQKRLLEEVFGIERLALAYGWSMGAQQALHWGAVFPDRVARICAVCGSAKTSEHNKVFLHGVRATLTADPAWRDGYFAERPVTGLRAMGRVYAGWALSQAFYREKLYIDAGFSSLEDWYVRSWEGFFLRRHGEDLLSMLRTWELSDISDNTLFKGDIDRALGAITADTVIMPSRTDLYFTPEDSRREAAGIPNALYLEIPSKWGHRAGNPVLNADDTRFIARTVATLLDRSLT
ncbi:MAG: alpha/beta fold hydrolase [Alphaproteobacteria bacterium]|nr:alpha/beta fold hydrolase [Alphaproteobacteria bacterium]